MYPRTSYEMTQEDLDAILDACRPVPYIVVGGIAPSSPQENANRAWAALGKKMGFDHMTVQPIHGKGQRFFSAVPSETESQRAERIAREAEEARLAEIAEIEQSVQASLKRLDELHRAAAIHESEELAKCER